MHHKFYKALLRIFVHKIEMSHLVIVMASFVLFYRVIIFFGHIQNINTDNVSFISQANAKAESSKEDSSSSPETHKTESHSSSPHTTPKKSPGVGNNPAEFDPLSIDENQIKILNALSTQKNRIAQSDETVRLEKEKELLQLAHENLTKKLAELEKEKKNFDTQKNELTAKEKEQVHSTVKMYESMKPAQSAEIFNQLELTAVTQIIKHMNPKKASAILASMDVNKARKVTFELLRTQEDSQDQENEETSS